VIDVFEAIRLFLQVSSTAFVIAANRAIVQAAVERRYPARIDGDPPLGKDYLEKILQIEVTVPPLAEPEAETYLNLLFAELRLDDASMQAVRAEAVNRRKQNQLSVAMNYGIAKGVLEQVPPELEADFTIANRIAPTLSRGLRPQRVSETHGAGTATSRVPAALSVADGTGRRARGDSCC